MEPATAYNTSFLNDNNASTSNLFVPDGPGTGFLAPHSHTVARLFKDSYCSQKRRTPFHPIRTIEEGVRIIEVILNKNVLCGHDVEEINQAYREIDLLERRIEQISEYSSQNALQKIIDKIKKIALAEKITPADLISLYHLQNFSDKELSINDMFKSIFCKFVKTIESIDEVASHLPCCRSEVLFDEDVKFLIGPEPEKDVVKILDRKKKKLKSHEHTKQSIAVRRTALVEQRRTSLQQYPPYLDELLDGGHLHLYDHLLQMRTLTSRIERRYGNPKMTFSQLSHVVLEAREAVIQKVESSIPAGFKNIVFLLGGTGAGSQQHCAFFVGM